MNRAQKALAENIVLAVRTRTMGWTYHEKKGYSGALYGAMRIAKNSLNLSPSSSTSSVYVKIILEQITDCIRIARTYHDMSADEIIVSLDKASDILR